MKFKPDFIIRTLSNSMATSMTKKDSISSQSTALKEICGLNSTRQSMGLQRKR